MNFANHGRVATVQLLSDNPGFAAVIMANMLQKQQNNRRPLTNTSIYYVDPNRIASVHALCHQSHHTANKDQRSKALSHYNSWRALASATPPTINLLHLPHVRCTDAIRYQPHEWNFLFNTFSVCVCVDGYAHVIPSFRIFIDTEVSEWSGPWYAAHQNYTNWMGQYNWTGELKSRNLSDQNDFSDYCTKPNNARIEQF